jgi:hypothetical protein
MCISTKSTLSLTKGSMWQGYYINYCQNIVSSSEVENQAESRTKQLAIICSSWDGDASLNLFLIMNPPLNPLPGGESFGCLIQLLLVDENRFWELMNIQCLHKSTNFRFK